MYLIINEADPDGQFLRDLTSVALGDSLFRAIRAITEFETSTAELANIPTKMEGVEAYFDTRFVFRALGFGAEQFTHAAAELLQLCKSTGCKTFIFTHNVGEIQRVIRTVADVMNYSGNVEGDIASYAYERGLSPGDLIDLASSIEERISASGFSVREPPPLTEALSIDESGLDAQLGADLRQATDEARIADVASLAAIYRLRRGASKRFLEKCDAIFITSNKGLADSSVKFFRKHFSEAGEQNAVQLCMTDVVFSTRLWTKLPTILEKLPRDQIVAHIMGHLRPSPRLREDFLQQLKKVVAEGTLTEEQATQIRLSRFVEQALATDFDAWKDNLSRSEFFNVAKRVIEKQKALQESIRDSIEAQVRTKIQEELTDALKQLDEAEAGLVEKDADIEQLKRQVLENAALIKSMEVTKDRLKQKMEFATKWLIRIAGTFCVFWVLDTVFSATSAIEDGLRQISQGRIDVSIAWVREASNKFAAVVLTALTLFGFSLTGLGRYLERKFTRRLMNFIYK